MSTPHRRSLMPASKGKLAFDGCWTRTDASRSEPTPIAITGAFPAHLVDLMKPYEYRRSRIIKVATACEPVSFDPGFKSGKDIDENYLGPLHLDRNNVCFFDMYPYYLASPAMYKSLQQYAQSTGQTVDVEQQPTPQGLVNQARNEPGNCDRIRWILDKCRPRLLLTLSYEVAAFVRGISYAAAYRSHLLYRDPDTLNILGYRVLVVHLAHPNSVSRLERWRDRHLDWCAGAGTTLIQQALRNDLLAA